MLSHKLVVLLSCKPLIQLITMGKNRKIQRENYNKREEEKANRIFKMICIFLILLGIIIGVGYALA